MAIYKSSNSGTPFGDTASRPSNPLVGQTYYNGQLGYLEIYTVSGWIPATGANDFSLNITGPYTEVTFNQTYSSGSYSVVSFLNDATIDIYAFATDGSSAGYSGSKAFTATQRFNKMVVIGGSTGDVLQFSYKTTYATSTSTTSTSAGPYITSITPSGMPNQNDTITITGGNFATNVAVAFTGTGYSSTAAKSIVRSSSTSLIVTRPDSFPVSGAPYTVTITNPSVANQPTSSAAHIYSGITAGVVPVWQTATTLPNSSGGSPYSTTLSATDADGSSTVTYSAISGSLPAGLSLNTSTGVISGTPTRTTSMSVSYTVRATDSGGNTADRTFTFSYSPVGGGTLASDATYYYNVFTGNGTFNTSLTLTADILTIAGGGGGGGYNGGAGGGAGGVLYSSGQSLSPAQYSVQVGSGGPGAVNSSTAPASNGVNSSFGSLIATGGGLGQTQSVGSSGGNGGSGGGAGGAGGSGTQTGTPGTGISGQGNNGGYGWAQNANDGGGGGGGAGGVGGNGSTNKGGNGGSGTNSYSSWLTAISSAMSGVSGWSTATSGGYIAGGGGGGSYTGSAASGGAGGGGAGGNGAGSLPGVAGTTNTGGGGGADGNGGNSTSGGFNGGSGLVIVRYTKAQVGG